jgi:hypothetical protein
LPQELSNTKSKRKRNKMSNYHMTWAERRRKIKNFHRLADMLWKAYDRMIRKRKKKKK